MMRRVLSVALCGLTLGVAIATSFVQVDNFEAGAELHRLSEESEWNSRRCSGIQAELERFEFDLSAEHTRSLGRVDPRPSR